MCIYLSLYISLSFARCVWQIRVPKFATSVITDAKYIKIYIYIYSRKRATAVKLAWVFFLAWNKPDIQTEIDRELWQRHRFRAAANSSGFYRHDSSLGSSTLQFSVSSQLFNLWTHPHIIVCLQFFFLCISNESKRQRHKQTFDKKKRRKKKKKGSYKAAYVICFSFPLPPPPPEYLRLIQVFVHCPHSMVAGHKHWPRAYNNDMAAKT